MFTSRQIDYFRYLVYVWYTGKNPSKLKTRFLDNWRRYVSKFITKCVQTSWMVKFCILTLLVSNYKIWPFRMFDEIFESIWWKDRRHATSRYRETSFLNFDQFLPDIYHVAKIVFLMISQHSTSSTFEFFKSDEPFLGTFDAMKIAKFILKT